MPRPLKAAIYILTAALVVVATLAVSLALGGVTIKH
jgi:hypothetical protein